MVNSNYELSNPATVNGAGHWRQKTYNMATKKVVKMNALGIIADYSNRTFAIAFIEGETATACHLFLEEILSDTSEEYKYAIHEHLDEVLDLHVGERMPMVFNRDNVDSAGYLKRIK